MGINDIQNDVPELAGEFLKAEATLAEVDVKVLTDKRTSELGRFAVTRGFDDLGSFKTPTLRNIAVTAPYMHDGSLKTLRDVVVHYNNGGVTNEGDPVNDFLSGGIRPLEPDRRADRRPGGVHGGADQPRVRGVRREVRRPRARRSDR